MLATAARILGSLAGLADALSAATTRRHGKVDAAAQIDGLRARVVRLDPALHHRVGEHDRRGGAVAGDLVGLHRDLAGDLRAHVLEPVGSSISEAMLTPSRVIIGVPIGRSIMAFRPLGPSVGSTAAARRCTPRASAWRASELWSIIFGT